MQYNATVSYATVSYAIPTTTRPISVPTSYSYDGQYHLMTDLSNASVYYSSENNVLIDVSLSTIAQKWHALFRGCKYSVCTTERYDNLVPGLQRHLRAGRFLRWFRTRDLALFALRIRCIWFQVTNCRWLPPSFTTKIWKNVVPSFYYD